MKCFDIILGGISCPCFKPCLLLTSTTVVLVCFPTIVIRGVEVFSKIDPKGSLHNDDRTNHVFSVYPAIETTKIILTK